MAPSKIETLIVDIIFSTYPIIWFFLFWPVTVILKFSPKFSDLWFANFYSILMNANKDGYDPFKNQFFASLKDGAITSCDQHLRNKNKFRLLEIGAGPGTNFKFYPRNASLIAIDNNPYFKKYFNDNLKEDMNQKREISEEENAKDENTKDENPKDENSNVKNLEILKVKTEQNPNSITLEKFILCSAEDMEVIEDNSVDVVVATHVLCSVKNPEKVLTEIHRVLTPGGKYYMLEHVAHRERLSNYAQWFIKPFWSVFNGGCNLQSDTLEVIQKSALFKGVEGIKYGILRPLPFPVNPNISGILVKA